MKRGERRESAQSISFEILRADGFAAGGPKVFLTAYGPIGPLLRAGRYIALTNSALSTEEHTAGRVCVFYTMPLTDHVHTNRQTVSGDIFKSAYTQNFSKTYTMESA